MSGKKTTGKKKSPKSPAGLTGEKSLEVKELVAAAAKYDVDHMNQTHRPTKLEVLHAVAHGANDEPAEANLVAELVASYRTWSDSSAPSPTPLSTIREHVGRVVDVDPSRREIVVQAIHVLNEGRVRERREKDELARIFGELAEGNYEGDSEAISTAKSRALKSGLPEVCKNVVALPDGTTHAWQDILDKLPGGGTVKGFGDDARETLLCAALTDGRFREVVLRIAPLVDWARRAAPPST